MTREEAITRYNAIKARGNFCEYLNEKMVDMAIQALSQDCVEPTQKHIRNALDMRCDECRNKHTSLCGNCIGYDEYEPCDDAISINAVDRFGVLNEIYEWTISGEYEQPRGTDTLIKRINNMPSVTQKSGKWITDRKVIDKSRKPTTYHFDTHCSECGFKYAYTTDKEDSIPTKYCPNCGADMREEQTDETDN